MFAEHMPFIIQLFGRNDGFSRFNNQTRRVFLLIGLRWLQSVNTDSEIRILGG